MDALGSEPELDLLVRMACKHADPATCILDTTVLTQLTDRSGSFRSRPRYDRERAISLILGKMSVADAYDQVVIRKSSRETASLIPPGTRVRYVTAGVLRENGFTVVHAPGRFKSNPHVSVCVTAGDWRSKQRIPWSPDTMECFESCFDMEDRREGDHES